MWELIIVMQPRFFTGFYSGTGMTGRPGRTMETIGRSTASYLTLFYACSSRSGSKGAFSFPGATWDRFRCAVEPSPGRIRCQIWSAKFRKIAGEFLSEFRWRMLPENFAALFFSRFQAPQKIMPKNCRHSSPKSLSRARAISAYGGDQELQQIFLMAVTDFAMDFWTRGSDFATDFVADFLSCIFLRTDFVTEFEIW